MNIGLDTEMDLDIDNYSQQLEGSNSSIETADFDIWKENHQKSRLSAIDCGKEQALDDSETIQVMNESELPDCVPIDVKEEMQNKPGSNAILAENAMPSGRRIVDIGHFIEGLQKMNFQHYRENCNFSDMKFFKEIKTGLNSTIILKCKVCGVIQEIDLCKNSKNVRKILDSNKTEELNLNEATALGIMSIGSGYYNLEEFLAILDIPCMSNGYYRKMQKKIDSNMQQAATKCMREAFDDEVKLAIEKGEIDKNGDPVLTVITDAAWSKRSYKNNYSAKSGVASLIGFHTKKVLWVGVKNKSCVICDRFAKTKEKPSEHECNSNYSGSSTGNVFLVIVLNSFLIFLIFLKVWNPS